jgi:hypothetical protein
MADDSKSRALAERDARLRKIEENRENRQEGEEDDLEDMLALYERGEVSADEMIKATGASDDDIRATIATGVTPFKKDDDRVYMSLNVLSRTEEGVTFRMGIQVLYGMELMGRRDFSSFLDPDKKTRRGTNCKHRCINGVTIVSMAGRLEWCPNGYYYSLMKMDHYGHNEVELGGGVFMEEDLRGDSELLGPDEAKQIRDFYEKMRGSSTYDPEEHNQVIRGHVLKVLGPDKKNYEITVPAADFELIEFAVREYNRYMNENEQPGEFHRHVSRMMRHDRLLEAVKEVFDEA